MLGKPTGQLTDFTRDSEYLAQVLQGTMGGLRPGEALDAHQTGRVREIRGRRLTTQPSTIRDHNSRPCPRAVMPSYSHGDLRTPYRAVSRGKVLVQLYCTTTGRRQYRLQETQPRLDGGCEEECSPLAAQGKSCTWLHRTFISTNAYLARRQVVGRTELADENKLRPTPLMEKGGARRGVGGWEPRA